MHIKSIIGVISLAAALLVPAVSSAKDVLADVKERGEMIVGTELQFPPFDFLEGGKQVGFNVELFEEIGKELGVKVKFVDLPWTNILPGLEAGKFDMVAGPNTLTAARLEKYYFNLPIAAGAIAILKKAGDTSIQKPEDIAGKTIGAQRETVSAKLIKEYGKDKDVKVREYIDNNQAYADLVAGRLDGVAHQSTNLYYIANKRKDTFEVVMPPLGAYAYFSYVGRKDDESRSFLEAVDNAILATKKDGRFAEIQKKWFGTTIDVPDTLPEPAF